MKKVTLISLVAIAILSSNAMAADPAAFQAEKEREIGNMQERLQIVQERLSCVQAATDSKALVVCNKEARAKGDALEAKIKAQMNAKKAQRDAKKAAKEATTEPAATPTTTTP